MMTPIVDGLEANYQGQIAFQRIDANRGDGPAVMRAYDVLGHPAILILDQSGQEVNRLLGPQSAEALETILQQTLTTIAE